MNRQQRLAQKYRALRRQFRQQQRLINQLTVSTNAPVTNDIVINGGSMSVTTRTEQIIPIYTEIYIPTPPAPKPPIPWIEDCDDKYEGDYRDRHQFDN
jgi:hypothetical protein